MDTRPIAVFDSGLGGLTAVRALDDILPAEDVIYLGDTQRVPYGGRSVETITSFALDDLNHLLKYDIKAVVIACGTVSTVALEAVKKAAGDIPVFGVVEGAAQRAVAATKTGRIGVIGTAASVRSGAYERRIKELLPTAQVFSTACPLFVPLVEAGRVKPGDVVIETVAREYLADIISHGVDTLVLGCTHYPHLTEILQGIMGEGVSLVNVGEEAVRALARHLENTGTLNPKRMCGQHRYLVTDGCESFGEMASFFLQRQVRGQVELVRLDERAEA